jgi:hypothetical protein
MIMLAALCGLATACGPTSPKSVPADTPAPAAAAAESRAPVPNADNDGLSQQIIGVWRSVGDANAEVAIAADGSLAWSYDGDVHSVDRWRLFAGNALPPFVKPTPGLSLSQTFDPHMVYLEVVPGDGGRSYLYAVGYVGPNDLEMSYLGPGRPLAFTRVQ